MSDPRTLTLVGTGAYTTHDAYGPGVIARSLAQWCARNGGATSWRIAIVYRSDRGRERAASEWKSIQAETTGVPEATFVRAGGEAANAEIANAHALFICVPDDAHAEYIEHGIAAGVPIWVVKPLTGDGRQSTALASAAGRQGIPVWVDYHKRFDVSNRVMRTATVAEEHGPPTLYSVRYSQPRDLPLDGFSWTANTNVFSYIGCHYVDQLFYLMPGLEVLDVSAKGIGGPVFEQLGGTSWDTVLARLDCEWRGRPVSAQFEVGWSNPLGSPTKSLQVVELAFERARFFIDQSRRGIETWSDSRVSVPNPYFFSRIHDPLSGTDTYQGYGYESIRHFLDFSVASPADQARALANDSLPWAREASRVDEILDRVSRSLGESA